MGDVKDIKDAQSDDVVALITYSLGENQVTFCAVERVTKTQILLKGRTTKFRREDGREIRGRDRYSSFSIGAKIAVITDELRATRAAQQLRARTRIAIKTLSEAHEDSQLSQADCELLIATASAYK